MIKKKENNKGLKVLGVLREVKFVWKGMNGGGLNFNG